MLPVSRRFVLTGAAIAATSLVIPVVVAPIRATDRKGGADYEITDWIVIASSGQVTLGLSQPEVGQGSYTALPADSRRRARRGLGPRQGSSS